MKWKNVSRHFMFYDFFVSEWGSPSKVFFVPLMYCTKLLEVLHKLPFFSTIFTIISSLGNKSSWWDLFLVFYSPKAQNIFDEFHFFSLREALMFSSARDRKTIKKKGPSPTRVHTAFEWPTKQWNQNRYMHAIKVENLDIKM